MMGRSRGQFKKKRFKPTFWIFCEGKTEKAYVDFLRRRFRLQSIVVKPKEIGSGLDNSEMEKAKTGEFTHDKDKNYLLYDLDVPAERARLLRIKGATGLFSNPCIELWFLLHFEEVRRHMSCSQVVDRLKRHVPNYKKGVIEGPLKVALEDNMQIVVERAKRFQDNAANPYTSVQQIIEDLSRQR